MSISRAQAAALRDGFLDSLGSKASTDKLPVIEAMLALAAQDFIEQAQSNLDNTDAVDTGALSTELRFNVETNAAVYTLSVGYDAGSKSAKYYDYVNQGVQGVNTPGKAPKSKYKFKFLGVSKKHSYAIAQWLRRNRKGSMNINPKHPVSGLERKRVSVRNAVDEATKFKSLVYAIATNSKKEGLRATEYFDHAVDSVFGPEFIEAMEIALGGEVIISIRQAQL